MEKEVFERIIIEFNEVNDRSDKLRNFILDKEKFEKLDALNRDLLISQLKAMETYSGILSIRLGLNAPREASTAQVEGEECESVITSASTND